MKVLTVALLTFVMLMAWHEAAASHAGDYGIIKCRTSEDCPMNCKCSDGVCIWIRSQLGNGDTHVGTTGNDTCVWTGSRNRRMTNN